jgi:hypothetical protein
MPEPAHEMAQNAASRTLARELVRTALENPGANIVDSPEARGNEEIRGQVLYCNVK